VCGRSNKLSLDEQGKLTGDAWERLPEPRPRLTLVVYENDGTAHEYLLGPHTPRMRPQDIGLMHNVWLDITRDPRFAGAHHYHVVALALEELQKELKSGQRQELLDRLEREIRQGQDSNSPSSAADYN